jgi:O-succinylhomoserine sulfhydrylase
VKYNNKELPQNLHMQTNLVRTGSKRTDYGETSEALFLNSGFCYNSAEIAESRFNGEDPGFVYSRYVNPNLKSLEDRLVALEKGAEAACVVSSGMAAVFAAIMCQIRAGDHVVANKVLFGSCYHIMANILPNYGVKVDFVDGKDNIAWQKAIKVNTKLIFIETPANPSLELVDIEFLSKICQKNNIFLLVDNIFATPLSQTPLKLGANAVIYSTTKHMDGQGRTLGGAVIGTKEFINEKLQPFYRHTGPALSPFNAWVIQKSLETFAIRYEYHVKNAKEIASFLEKHSQIAQVLYPGLRSHPQYKLAQKQMASPGALIAFKINGDKNKAFKFMNNLKIIDISNNLGDSRTLITHPASTTHSNIEKGEQLKIGITENLLRISVGIEHIDDLLADIEQALTN